jgi:hypothetical protein
MPANHRGPLAPGRFNPRTWATTPMRLNMPDHGLFDYGRKIQTETLPDSCAACHRP